MIIRTTIKLFLLSIVTSLILTSSALAQSGEPIYRLLNTTTGEHLYTAFPKEADTLVYQNNWKAEGSGWVAPSNGGESIYRLFNPNSGQHLYTKDSNEVKHLSSLGWSVDNSGEPVIYSGGKIPIYRLYDPINFIHHYTTDKGEYNNLIRTGWRGEGPCFYGQEAGSLPNISNIPSEFAIEADVYLTGSGSGYHAKLVGGTELSAISFGLQYDTAAPAPFTNQTTCLLENIESNNPGGQVYTRASIGVTGATSHLLMAISNGTCIGYVNGKEVGRCTNPELINKKLDLRVEGSARLNGDSVDCTFSDIKLKNNGYYNAYDNWHSVDIITNPTIGVFSSDYISNKTVRINGAVSGLTPQEDWDSAFDRVSGIVSFYNLGGK